MRRASVRSAFLAGATVLLALYIFLTWNSLRSAPIAVRDAPMPAAVAAGQRAWHKYLCVDCHTISGKGGSYGPDLTHAWSRFLQRAGGDEAAARSSMLAFLQHPPNATIDRRAMPNLRISAEEGRGLVEFLRWTALH